MFGTILTSVFTFMHVYVFWRATSLTFVNKHVPRKILIGMGVILWAFFFFGRLIRHGVTGILPGILELIGMNWMAVLFLISIPLLVIDFITLFGFLMPRLSMWLRGLAFLVGIALSLIALLQGLRPPVIEKYEVIIPGLPEAMEGKVLVALSDLHLGSQTGERWLSARIAQVQAQHPDLVVLLGDIFEGHRRPESRLITTFNQLSAPMGVWAVSGNHEFHGGDMSMFKEASFKLLRNAWTEVSPGLIIAGVDDLTYNHRKNKASDSISKTLAGRSPGVTILLSHSPLYVDRIAKAGVELMLCGHTHGGQIWPFDYLVRRRYPLLEGLYKIDGMTVIVCRGTGTWGPRMRLWSPGEILHVTLRGEKAKG